ncbi:rubrerythrin family protein [Desulfococcaceae bacterium HSG7]|nr:rubrerythrin family protein [Desulfococcaceae bacterium HSG9]MDM8556244.1 rubrerythrin family protein [Desulfococcaceae bacterium HSG7]
MGKFKESRTAKNLLTSYAFESQANTRYHFFANKAEDDGYIQIAHIFKEVADQEFEHALRFFKFFNGGELEITATFLTGVIKATYDNLIASANLENNVHTKLYPGFAAVAREENFERAAETWDAISIAEKQHEKSFLALSQNIKSGKIFKREEKVIWRCRNCGYLHEGTDAPDKCPACVRPSGHFEILCENW